MRQPAIRSFAIKGEPAVGAPTQPRDLLPIVLISAFAVGLLNRSFSGWTAPYWLDENFSLVIASQPDFAHLLKWMLHELSGPVYYSTLWAWGLLAGHGDIAIRIPSFACSVAAPLVVLWGRYADRRTCLIWAALLALWVHGVDQATQARPYSMLTLLSVIQTMAYLRLLQAPSTRRAMLWVGMCDLTILTHYYALIIAGIQGLLFLAAMPRTALRCWPAGLLLLPLLGWMSVHLPFVLGYANSGQTWYNYVSFWGLVRAPTALLGFAPFADAMTLGMLVWGGLGLAGTARGHFVFTPQTRAYALVATSALLAILVVLGWGLESRVFTMRYLLPYGPPALFALAWWLSELDTRINRHASTVLIATLLCLSLFSLRREVMHPRQDARYAFNFEQPDNWFLAQGATQRLVFFWDNPTADFSDPEALSEVGAYFLRRAGAHPQVIVPRLPPDADPNPHLLALAGTRPGTAILWAYDTAVPHSRGIAHPPRLNKSDPHWNCRNFGRNNITVLGCIRR